MSPEPAAEPIRILMADDEDLIHPQHENRRNQASDDPSVERVYPRGAISRISGRLRMEGEVRAVGQLTSLTYQLPDEDSSADAFAAAAPESQLDAE